LEERIKDIENKIEALDTQKAALGTERENLKLEKIRKTFQTFPTIFSRCCRLKRLP